VANIISWIFQIQVPSVWFKTRNNTTSDLKFLPILILINFMLLSTGDQTIPVSVVGAQRQGGHVKGEPLEPRECDGGERWRKSPLSGRKP